MKTDAPIRNECPGAESPDGNHCEHLYSDGLCCWCDADPYGLFTATREQSPDGNSSDAPPSRGGLNQDVSPHPESTP